MSLRRPLRFVALGDSTTVGLGDPLPGGGWRGWASLLALAMDAVFINVAVNGATAADVSGGQLEKALVQRPHIASVLVGVNDTLRGNFRADVCATHLERTVAGLTAAARDRAHRPDARPGPDAVVAGRAGPPAGPPNRRGEHRRRRHLAPLWHGSRRPRRRSADVRASTVERRPAASVRGGPPAHRGRVRGRAHRPRLPPPGPADRRSLRRRAAGHPARPAVVAGHSRHRVGGRPQPRPGAAAGRPRRRRDLGRPAPPPAGAAAAPGARPAYRMAGHPAPPPAALAEVEPVQVAL
ncbi:GDSL-type esterase/lipase family protein [Fodinicola feengrottensis]|uniref:GDSL-type esterase/lipase family protein n=1 Tax=Fodinicola feengrottensis TaxID=435914 RepID=UPI0036F1A0CC